MTTPVLDVQNLTTTFRRDGAWREVVHGVSFSVAPGETVALVGESGSGKSVSALSILRLTPRDASRIGGRVLLDGRDLLRVSEAEMRRVRGNDIAMVFQEPMTSLNPVLTIGFQIAEGLMLHRGLSRAEAEAETVRLLDRVRIPAARARMHDYPHRFSGGMRQRVVIAMALACRPKLLIADEPTTALDVTIQAQILDLIKALQAEEGMSVLFITHDMGVVAEIADRTVVMFAGRAVEAGETASIFARAQHPYTRALLSAVPKLGAMAGQPRPARFPITSKTTGEIEPMPSLPGRRGRRPGGSRSGCPRRARPHDPVRHSGRRLWPATRSRSCGRERLVFSRGRRDPVVGRRVGLWQVDDRSIDPAPHRTAEWRCPARR